MQVLKSFVAFLWMYFAVSASAKLGETVPELVKRFGKSYTVEEVQLGNKYTGAQREDSVWIMTVGLAKTVRALSNTTSSPANPSFPTATAIPTATPFSSANLLAPAAPTPNWRAGKHLPSKGKTKRRAELVQRFKDDSFGIYVGVMRWVSHAIDKGKAKEEFLAI